MKTKLLVCLVSLVAMSSQAFALDNRVQSNGHEVWAGKYMAEARILGGRVYFPDNSSGFPGTTSAYQIGGSIYGRIKDMPKLTLWLGGSFNYNPIIGHPFVYNGPLGHDVEFIFQFMITFEKLVPIPLVPWARAGFGFGPIIAPNPAPNSGEIGFKLGTGADYWLLKWLGLGLSMDFTFGGIFASSQSAFHGEWDFTLPVKFSF